MATGPARRAFLLGCNSAGLKHCESDAKITMFEALSRYDYDITTCTTSQLTEWCRAPAGPIGPLSPRDLVSTKVSHFLQDCPQGSTALFYFSGHSLFRGGVFNLVVGTEVNAEDHLFSVEALVAVFKQHSKPAERLLILDCCEAEKAASLDAFWNTVAENWGRIWVATRTNAHAQELDGTTNGGLFTAFVCRALTTCAPALADDRGCLRINDADKFVRQQATDFLSDSGKRAPTPSAFGSSRHDILLADGIEPALTTGVAPAAMSRAAELIRQAGVEATELARIYEEVVRLSGIDIAADSDGSMTDGAGLNLAKALHVLERAWYREVHRVRFPLGEFLERVARRGQNAEDLRSWIETTVRGLAPGGKAAVFLAQLHLGQTERHEPPPPGQLLTHLAILLWSRDRNRRTGYDVQVRLVDAQGRGLSIEAPPCLTDLKEMPQLMTRVLDAPALLNALRQPGVSRPLTIEVFLPGDLLGLDLDQWTPVAPHSSDGKGAKPLSARYILVVRPAVRLGLGSAAERGDQDPAAPYVADWGRRWNNCEACREERSSVPGSCWIRLDAPRRHYATVLRHGACIFFLGFKPDLEGKDLDGLLREGSAAVIWSSDGLDEACQQALLEEVEREYPQEPKRPCFEDLPYSLLFLRQQIWEETDWRDTGRLHLLWDDPQRVPEFSGRAGATSDAAAGLAGGFRLGAPTVPVSRS